MMPDALPTPDDPRQLLFLLLMGLLMMGLLIMERRRIGAQVPAAPVIHPPRPMAGPLAWDGPPDEVPEEALFGMARGDWPAAHRALWASLTEAPSDWHYYHLALALHHQGRLGEAEACYRTTLDVAPDIPEALYNMAVVLADTGRWSEAIVTYRRLLKLRPDWVDAHVNLGHVYFQLRMYEEAHRAWHEAANMQPRAKDVQANLRFVSRLGRLEKARKRPA